MKVVLNKDVAKLGYKGDTVNVKPGYHRNFLLPKGLADLATESRIKLAAVRNEKRVLKKQQLLDNSKEVLAKLKGLKVIVKAKTSDKGTLYASITETDVIEAIEKKAKLHLEREYLKMEHFKELGEYTVLVHLGEGLEEKVKVSVKNAK